MKLTAGSYTNEELDEKIERIVKKVLGIADTYFKYPLKIANEIRVPFSEHDIVRIRFKEPIKFVHDISSRCDIDSCTASVKTSLAARSIVEIKWSFRNGIAEYMETRDVRGYIYYFEIYPTLYELAKLFTPNIFKRIEEAEIQSIHGIAEKWFISLIDAYREVRKLVSSVNLKDLYDTSKTIKDVFIEFSNFRLDNVEYATIMIHLNRIFKTIEIDVPALHDRVYYYVNPVEFIWRGEKEIRSLVIRFPERLLDDVERFIRKFFDAYLYTSIAIRYTHNTF